MIQISYLLLWLMFAAAVVLRDHSQDSAPDVTYMNAQ